MRIVAIVGSRTKDSDEANRVAEKVQEILDNIDPAKDIVISGGCGSGADYWTKKLCSGLGYRYLEAVCFWGGGVKKPTLYRNTTIAMVCTELHAVWDGESPGTAHVMDEARTLGKPVTIHRF